MHRQQLKKEENTVVISLPEGLKFGSHPHDAMGQTEKRGLSRVQTPLFFNPITIQRVVSLAASGRVSESDHPGPGEHITGFFWGG